MAHLERFFTNHEVEHPRLRRWRALAGDEKPTVEIQRAFDGLSYGPAVMRIRFAGPSPDETEPWNPELDLEMIKLGWTSPTVEAEAQRLALHLRRALGGAERKYGDGYLNSVLVAYFRSSELGDDPRIADLLRHIHVNQAGNGEAVRECREVIEAAIRTMARFATANLNYSRDHAEKILTGAVAQYLDERFSISAGRNLGLYL